MAVPLKFQHFEVEQEKDGAPLELGRGAMGITYKAFDTNLGCHVALKVINGEFLNNEVARGRFLREARAAAALRHPNIASVFHLGEENGTYFYAMEFVDGETLEHYIQRRGKLAAPTALRLALQIARGLGAAEKQGLVHRDIKPANLMLISEPDEGLVIKIIDFGLAKVSTAETTDHGLTVDGFVGTPHFASPEQLEEGKTDIRSDIYSVGVTIWYMLEGKPPFGGSLAQVMSQQLSKTPPVEKLTNVPQIVVSLIQRMMSKLPADRPASALQLRHEIETCLAQLGYSTRIANPAQTKNEETVDRHAAPPPSQMHPSMESVQSILPVSETPNPVSSKLPEPPKISAPPKKLDKWKQTKFSLIVASILVSSAIVLALTKQQPKPTRPVAAVTPLPEDTAAAQPLVTPAETDPSPIAIPTSIPFTTPIPPPTPTSTPWPAPETIAMEAALKIDPVTNFSDAVNAYIVILRLHPENREAKVRLAALFIPLIAGKLPPDNLSKTEFLKKQMPAIEAAKVTCVPAMIFLGEQLFSSSPDSSAGWFQQAANQGDTLSMCRLGQFLAEGHGTVRSVEKAVEWYEKAAEGGDPRGQALLAECLLNGKGTQTDQDRAIQLLEKAALAGEPYAMVQLGTLYDHGSASLKRDPKKAFELYLEASKKNNSVANRNLGIVYFTGRPPFVEKDPAKSEFYFAKAAMAGDPDAVMWYADLLAHSNDPKKVQQAVALLRTHVKLGVPQAKYGLAVLYQQGLGVEKNEAETKRLVTEAAAAGFPTAVEWCKKYGVIFSPNTSP